MLPPSIHPKIHIMPHSASNKNFCHFLVYARYCVRLSVISVSKSFIHKKTCHQLNINIMLVSYRCPCQKRRKKGCLKVRMGYSLEWRMVIGMTWKKKRRSCSVLPFLVFFVLFFAVFIWEKGKILGKTIFSLLGSSSTFIAIWDAYLSTA